MNEQLIEARAIKKNFNKGKIEIPVLRGIDISISRGETVAIIGSSGAGKSTLLHILGSLDKPSSGKVLFNAKDGVQEIFSISEDARSRFRNRHMGFVFQFHHLLPEFSALENVMMPGLIAGRSESTLKDEALNWLSVVGLKDRINHKPGELSGGECQRTAVARALFMKPDIVFGDELTGNLDSENSAKLIDLLLDINKQFRVALLLVTHDLNVARRMSRIIEIKDGHISV